MIHMDAVLTKNRCSYSFEERDLRYGALDASLSSHEAAIRGVAGWMLTFPSSRHSCALTTETLNPIDRGIHSHINKTWPIAVFLLILYFAFNL
jgi:hypothetical protein